HLYEHGVMLCDTLLGEGFKVDRSFLSFSRWSQCFLWWTCLSEGGVLCLKVVCNCHRSDHSRMRQAFSSIGVSVLGLHGWCDCVCVCVCVCVCRSFDALTPVSAVLPLSVCER